MLRLVCSNDKFEYDTYLLVKEFWPKEEIKRQNVGSDAFLKDSAAGGPDGDSSGEPFGDEVVIECLYDKCRTVITLAESDDSKEFKACAGCKRFEYPVPDGLDEKEYKKAHMRNLYLGLSEITGIQLPWGNLTGVRPTKPARQMYLDGATDGEVARFYKETRFVSDEKAALASEIAKREAKILSAIDPINGYSLYIGIPFCPTRCAYCSFLSNPIAKWQSRVDEYLGCLKKELDFTKQAFAGKKLDTIYIGGGTPTALSADELKVLMEMLNPTPAGLLEFTVEAGRPDSITREKLRVLKEAGVSRISVNPQTMNEETLKRIGRAHTVEQTREAFALAREEGFDNINMDLILGLPGEGLREVEYTLSEVEKMRPDSLTVHSLAIKRSALMKEWVRGTGDEGHATLAKLAYETAQRLNLNPYYLYRQKNIAGNLENVGFAKEGLYGIYNILMMEEVQSIVALGAGTVSKRVLSEKDISRCDTAKDIGLYMDNIDEMIARKKELFC